MTKIDIDEDDIVIRRVSNGWLVKSLSEHNENYFISKVFEDSDCEFNICSILSVLVVPGQTVFTVIP